MDKPDQIEEMKLSRVMRRAKAKLAKQERRNVPQRRVITNPVQHAILRAAKLTPAEVKLMVDPIKEDIQALRTGKFNNTMFKHLADSFNVAQALTEPGIGLLPDHIDKFTAVHHALDALAKRKTSHGSWVAKTDELRTIETGIEFHEIQLEYASAGELSNAALIVHRRIQGALQGNQRADHIHTILVNDE